MLELTRLGIHSSSHWCDLVFNSSRSKVAPSNFNGDYLSTSTDLYRYPFQLLLVWVGFLFKAKQGNTVKFSARKFFWPCWGPAVKTLPTTATAPLPHSSHSHHPNVKKISSGVDPFHCEFPDPWLIVSVIVTQFHGPSNDSKSSILELLKPGCDVTHPRAPASSGCKKMNLRSDLGPPHY